MSASCAPNHIVNGGFEQGYLGFPSYDYHYVESSPPPINPNLHDASYPPTRIAGVYDGSYYVSFTFKSVHSGDYFYLHGTPTGLQKGMMVACSGMANFGVTMTSFDPPATKYAESIYQPLSLTVFVGIDDQICGQVDITSVATGWVPIVPTTPLQVQSDNPAIRLQVTVNSINATVPDQLEVGFDDIFMYETAMSGLPICPGGF